MTAIELLKQDNDKLQTSLLSSQQEVDNLNKRLEQFQQAYDVLQNIVIDLRRHRFGKKSERVIDPDNPQLLFPLFDKELKQDETKTEDIEVPSHKRRKKVKKDTSALPREIQIIPVAEEDKICVCGCQKQVIRYEIKELFHYIPSELSIIEQRREVVACTKGCAQSIQTAPTPKHILPKAKATEELLASTIINKLHHRQPLYHIEKYTELNGISRETLARWHINTVKPLQPIFNIMADEIISYDIASIDATTLQVLKEPGRAPETKSYIYCIRGGPPDKPVILYAYNAEKHKSFVDNLFEGFKGSIHMDADPFFELLLEDKNVHATNCNSHARRKFEGIFKQTQHKKGLAYEALGFYRALYKIEHYAKQKKMTPAQRYLLRLEKSKPILDKFKKWLDYNVQHIMPKSPLGNAFQYCLNHWAGLIHFLTDGRLEIDNNSTEQQIKPIVIARKNFMFANSVDGAHALAMHFSLIRTALANNLNPYKYYVSLLKQIPHCESVDDYIKLLP